MLAQHQIQLNPAGGLPGGCGQLSFEPDIGMAIHAVMPIVDGHTK